MRPLGREDPLVEGMATHSSILALSQGQRSQAGYSPWGRRESDTTERLSTHARMQRVYKLKFLRGTLARDTDLEDFKI